LTLFRLLDFDRRDRAEHTCHQHFEILDRIMAMDAPGARAAMQNNIEEGRRLIPTTIKDALARAYLKRSQATEP
jgi:DNA-binding GntR family transcriptional regulator